MAVKAANIVAKPKLLFLEVQSIVLASNGALKQVLLSQLSFLMPSEATNASRIGTPEEVAHLATFLASSELRDRTSK